MPRTSLAGRFAGGRAYGYRKVVRLDDRGEPIRGLIEIDERQAAVANRILRGTAAGMSGIQIARRLNEDGVPGPRGGQWNASTIRGDVTKAVGIVPNPLYVGRLVWGRREWRKNPDSDRRERRYRLRDASEWIEVSVPDLQIVDDDLWAAAQSAVASTRRAVGRCDDRARQPAAPSPIGKHPVRRVRTNYVISGKDYYRCASQKERGTCGNTLSVRKDPLEQAALGVLADRLLTPEHARLFTDEFKREVARLDRERSATVEQGARRLAEVEVEIANLIRNMLAGVLGPTADRAV